MKTYFKLGVSAVALLGAALYLTPAMADGNNVTAGNHQWSSTGSISIDGDNAAMIADQVLQYASGNIGVNNASGNLNSQANVAAVASTNDFFTNRNAKVWSSQKSDHSWSISVIPGNKAELKDSVLQNASGNIGVNNVAGDGNAQANLLSVLNQGVKHPFFNYAGASAADSHMSQHIDDSFSGSGIMSNTAKLETNVLRYATGNIGVNNAAGNANMQANGAVVVATDGLLGEVSGSVHQGVEGISFNLFTNNYARLDDNVLQNASGNIGVNNVAGNANAQVNMLSVGNE